ncbi:MAG: hypothetical protein LBB78_03925, partial [Spirochaetaceae bacterium]|nr:hypothetical protein [Spirochaetaceae bacterium]
KFPAFNITADYEGSVFFNNAENRRVRITVTNSLSMRQQQWARITLYTPPDVCIPGGRSIILPLNNLWGSKAEVEFTIDTSVCREAKLEIIVDVSLEGRHSSGQMKLTLMKDKASGSPA